MSKFLVTDASYAVCETQYALKKYKLKQRFVKVKDEDLVFVL